MKIEGALLQALHASVHKLWRRIAWSQLRPIAKLRTSLNNPKDLKRDGIKAALVFRDNIMHRRDIEDAYLAAIQNAKSEIIIANAYFVPGWLFRRVLLEAVSRGVSVKLLLQGRVEYFAMFATHAFYRCFCKMASRYTNIVKVLCIAKLRSSMVNGLR